MKITEIQIWNDDVIRMTDENDYQYEITEVKTFEMWLGGPTISAINYAIKHFPSLWNICAIKLNPDCPVQERIDQMERPLDSQPKSN